MEKTAMQFCHQSPLNIWEHSQYTDYVFPRNISGNPITASSAAQIYQRAKKQAGIKKNGGIHALRHAFATHMLEAGVNLFFIKELLGHSSIHSTARYLRFVPYKDKTVKSPLDSLSI
jgi:integrase/recombinase XerD